MATSDKESRPNVLLIERVQVTSDETPPWNGLAFVLPVGSDRLSEDLKRKYPHCSTLRERKHMAAIDFLEEELRQMRSKKPSSDIIEHDYPASREATSISSDAFEDRGRRVSTSSSQSPVSTTPDPMSLLHPRKQVESITAPSAATSPVPSTIKAAQQFVFSVVDGRSLQPKTKRRMTREEKAEYRTTRKHGACLTCRRQKGKCTHVGNASTKVTSLDGVSKPRKRTISLDLGVDRSHKNAAFKPIYQVNIPQPGSDASPRSDQIPFQSSKFSTSITESSSQSERVPDDSKWDQEVEECVRSDLPRYVQHQSLVDPYGMSIPREPNSSWHGFSTTTGAQSFSSEYPRYEVPDIPEILLPLSPTANPSPMDLSYQSTFPYYLQNSWPETQEDQPEHTEPG